MAEQSIPLTLSLPSDLRFMSVARAFVEAACHADWWSRTDTDAIVLSVHEAISNVIRHAHRNLPQAQLQIQCYSGPSAIEVLVLDEGEAFDLSDVPQLDPGEVRLGGRGVFLMRTLMDELRSEPRGERGNVLRMVKYRGRESRLNHCG